MRRIPFWPVIVVADIGIAALALGLVAQLDWTLRVADLDEKIQAVRAGRELSIEPFAPFGLIQPQAQEVTATWIGQAPAPPSLSEVVGHPPGRPLILFGQNSGTTVLYDRGMNVVLRVPSGSVHMVTSVPELRE